MAREKSVPSGFQDPTWGQPAAMPSQVRFTRTPDRILKERRRQAAGRFPAEEAEPAGEAVRAPRHAEQPPLPRPSIALRRGEPGREPQSIPSAPKPHRAPRQIFGPAGEAVSRDKDPASESAPDLAAQAVAQASSQAPAAQETVRQPTISVAHGFAAFDLPAVRQSYSFLWQPGTYVIDPTLKAAAPTPARHRPDDRVKVSAEALPAESIPTERISAEENVLRSRPESRPPVRPEAPAGDLQRRAAAPPIPLARDEQCAPAAGRAMRSHAPVAAHDAAPARASFAFERPPLDLLGEPDASNGVEVPVEVLQENAAILENVL